MTRIKTNRSQRGRNKVRSGRRLKVHKDSTICWNRWCTAGLLAIIATSLAVNCIGLSWGRSGLVPWSPDSIEGITTVRELPRMFGQWKYKYPRVHFAVNGLFYKPFLAYWKANPIGVRSRDGRVVPQVLNLERLDLLAQIARIICVVMGTGTVIVTVLIGLILFKDRTAALLAGLALALTQLFVFYSHVGNVDVPYIFWFSLGIYLAVKAIYVGKWRHYALMGLFFSLSICTKDAVVGYLVGMVPAFWLAMIGKARADGQSYKTAVLLVFSKKVLVAVAVFLFSYALLQDVFTSPQAFAERISIWLGGRGVTEFNKDFSGQLPLLRGAFLQVYSSLGWPLLAAVVVSLIYCGIKHPWKTGFLALPLIAFYVVVVVNIRMSGARYYLPAYVGFGVLAGKTFADLLRFGKIHIGPRIFVVAGIYILSLLYCIGLDLELLSDTRIRTEQWFCENVPRRSIIGAGLYNKVYAPRLYLSDYYIICPWRSSDSLGVSGGSGLRPDYLIMTPGWPCIDEQSEAEFRAKLFDGKLDYEQVASFKIKYLYPGRSIFGFAGWPSRTLDIISPEMVVFKKR